MRQALENLDASEMAMGLNEGRWTSVELTAYFLGQISEQNSRTHAVVAVDSMRALKQAQASDQRRARGATLSPVDGLPMTLKDAFRMKGLITTYGFWMFSRYRAKSDCKMVRALRESGIVFMARTAVPTASFDWNCRNQVYPECVNPYDPKRTPGGSSGGAAAALATRMTPLEVGSDLGGSIRYPAHCCGIFGLRTTDGWLPIGDFGPESFKGSYQHLVTCGPMARSLNDLDLVLKIFAKAFPLPSRPPPLREKKTIAYAPEIGGLSPDRSTQRLFTKMLEGMRALGHQVVEDAPPFDWNELYRDWGLISGHEFASIIPKLLRNHTILSLYARLTFERRLGPGDFSTFFKQGMLSSQTDYQAALRRYERIRSDVDRFFAKYDLWILPVAASAAIPLAYSGKSVPTENGEVSYSRYLGAYTVPTTMLGTPALTCPIGVNEIGLPVAVQVHGARFSDRRLVAAAAQFENLWTSR